MPGLAVWDGGGSFWLAGGRIVTGAGADRDALLRFALIAAALGGVIQGEEGEMYAVVDGELVDQRPPAEPRPSGRRGFLRPR